MRLTKRIINKALEAGLLTGNYICHDCGGSMEFEFEGGDVLVCPACGHSVDLDDYGMEDNEDYDNTYKNDDFESYIKRILDND